MLSTTSDLALEALLQAAATMAPIVELEDPGARLALARQLRARAERLVREADLLEALALGLSCVAEAAVDAGRQVEITEDEAE